MGARAAPAPLLALGEDGFTPTMDERAFEAAVLRAKEYIAAGGAFQVVLSRRLDCAREADPFTIDALSVDEVERLVPERIVISPGPGNLDQAGMSLELIRRRGATIARATRQIHGKTSDIRHDGRGVVRGVPDPFVATRYHSLVVRRDSVPPDPEVTADADDGEILGIRHRRHPVEGVQSILTVEGKRLLGNFLAGAPA